MRIFILLMLILGVSTPASAFTVYGAGATSCASALGNRAFDQNRRGTGVADWVMGYVGGSLAHADFPEALTNKIANYDLNGMTYLVKRECENNPTMVVGGAINNVIYNLKNEN